MKGSLLILLCCFSLQGFSQKPNIAIVNIDDMGWRDTGFMGSEFYETPNIDALSKQGMVFTQGYAAASNCAPSRASLLTGEWPTKHGIYTVGTSERGKSKDRKIIPVKNQTSLSKSEVLLPQVLKNAGYAACHAGKWHVTDNPLNKGFEVNIGGATQATRGVITRPIKMLIWRAQTRNT